MEMLTDSSLQLYYTSLANANITETLSLKWSHNPMTQMLLVFKKIMLEKIILLSFVIYINKYDKEHHVMPVSDTECIQ